MEQCFETGQNLKKILSKMQPKPFPALVGKHLKLTTKKENSKF
jgi:hypothetical protein